MHKQIQSQGRNNTFNNKSNAVRKRTGLFHFLDMSEKSGSKYLNKKKKANEEEVEDNDGRRCQDQDLKD